MMKNLPNIIETERLILLPWKLEDSSEMQRILNDESISKNLISGCAQWFPERTHTPSESKILATSCGCTPFILNDITPEWFSSFGVKYNVK